MKKDWIYVAAAVLILIPSCVFAMEQGKVNSAENSIENNIENSIENSIEMYEEEEMELVGGWEIADNAAVDEDLKNLFDNAMADRGIKAEAVALLGTQIVAGRNYCFLAKVKDEPKEGASAWMLMYVYQDLQGHVKLFGYKGIKMGDMSYDLFGLGEE